MTKVAVLCVGSRGDVQPYLALAEHLASEGYSLTFATHDAFRAMVEGRELRFETLPGDPREQIRSEQAAELVASSRGMVRFVRRFSEMLEPWLGDLVEAVSPLCEDADVVVYSPLAFMAWHVGEAYGTPTVLAALQPYAPTRVFPTVTLAGRRFGPWGNLATHHLAEQVAWQSVRRTVNRLRIAELGLPPVGWRGPGPELRRRHEPHLFAFSRHVVPKPADWGPQHHVTGYWFLQDRDEQLPPDLVSFLAAGEPPVFAGFGSMATSDAGRATEIVIEACRLAGVRLVVATGWGGLASDVANEHVVVVDEVPHRVLFPHIRAVVHHGGAGTTGVAFGAGLPQIVVPFFGDQRFWAWRVAASGTGPAPVPWRGLSIGSLEAALRDVTAKPAYRDTAIAIAARITAEDALVEATRVIESIHR